MSYEITSLYTEGDYLKGNPCWHAERSPWKAMHVSKGLSIAQIQPASVCDIGCGTGLALAELKRRVSTVKKAVGYEPSSDAPIHPEAKDLIEYRREDATTSTDVFDLAMMLDVFEHVEDYIGFLRNCHHLATYYAFHIPLDATVIAILTSGFAASRKSLGHLHYFTRVSALATLEHCGYQPIHWHFTKSGWEGPPSPKNKRNPWSMLNVMRRTIHVFSPEYTHRLLGGLSLLVIAKAVK